MRHVLKGAPLLLALWLMVLGQSPLQAASGGHEPGEPYLSETGHPLAPETFPKRPRLLLEWGEPFLKTGPLSKGFKAFPIKKSFHRGGWVILGSPNQENRPWD
ncbi:MAG: hypothetical protein GKR89_34575 [Candidatus Latescibacteria bacterium]|nr:hypothetical protein [Candidatus Latescibacterota bacterium]